jgi:hypothetical protein
MGRRGGWVTRSKRDSEQRHQCFLSSGKPVVSDKSEPQIERPNEGPRGANVGGPSVPCGDRGGFGGVPRKDVFGRNVRESGLRQLRQEHAVRKNALILRSSRPMKQAPAVPRRPQRPRREWATRRRTSRGPLRYVGHDHSSCVSGEACSAFALE